MADNVTITPGTGATVLADELTDATLGTGKAQFVKLMDGTLDSPNKAIVNSSGQLLARDDAVVAAITSGVTSSIPPGSNVIGGVTQSGTWTVTGTFWQATQPVSGTFWQTTQPVSLATLPSLATGSNTIGTVNQAAITKGTQGATGVTTQNLKDSGRTYVNLYLDAITGITTEALATMNINTAGTVTTGTAYTVPTGKIFRIQSMTATVKASSTTAVFGRVRLRSGATVSATSGILLNADIPNIPGTAAAGTGFIISLDIPDGLEVAAAQQLGISHIENSTTSTVSVHVVGYYY